MAIRSIKKPQQPAQPEATGDEIRERIREAAYYRAQQRGFHPGYEVEDWLAAESQVRDEMAKRPAPGG